jgi:hypothetical protein
VIKVGCDVPAAPETKLFCIYLMWRSIYLSLIVIPPGAFGPVSYLLGVALRLPVLTLAMSYIAVAAVLTAA